MPEPIDWPPGTPERIRNPIPRRELCDCGLLLSEAERDEHACTGPGIGAGTLTDIRLDGIDPRRLTIWQLKGIACARCGLEMRPPAVRDTRYIGTLPDCLGRPVPLWARAPVCPAR